MNNKRLFNLITLKFRELGTPMTKLDPILAECVTEGFPNAWEVPKQEIENALSARGIALSNGFLSAPASNATAYPGSAGYRDFQNAARRAMRMKYEPVMAVDLIDATKMSGEAVPYANMKEILSHIGIRFIPGHGYWKHAIYSEPFTRTVSVSVSPRRINGVIPLFRQYGWPVSGREVERWSNGVTTSRSMSHEASKENIFIRPIGMGMYVPADQPDAIPMSCNVAERMLNIKPDEWIIDHDDLRCYRIAKLMARQGLAEIKESRSTRRTIRYQRLLFTPNRPGLAMLLKAARRPAEVF